MLTDLQGWRGVKTVNHKCAQSFINSFFHSLGSTPNVGVEKHRSGQTQESQTSDWDKRRSGQTQDIWDKRRSGQTQESPNFFSI